MDLALRTKLIKTTIVLAFVAGIILSRQLWLTRERFFPALRPFDALPVLPYPLDIILLLLFLVLCTLWIFYRKTIIGLLAIGFLILVLLQDQMRWQPWVYLYFLMLLPNLIQPKHAEQERLILTVSQWIIAGVYCWSGIHKFNPNFPEVTFTQILKATGMDVALQYWQNAGYIIPILEISTGLALLVPKVRKVGVFMAMSTHLIILFFLSPIVLNHNPVVYPWNVAMIVFVCLLFWGDSSNPIQVIRTAPPYIAAWTPLVLACLFPVLNLFGYWDHYLSFSLYSDKPSKFYIAIEESALPNIDKRFEDYFAEIPGLQGGQLIDVNQWAYSELNVPFYPERSLFKKLGITFCTLGIDHERLIFLELRYSGSNVDYVKFTCLDLNSQ